MAVTEEIDDVDVKLIKASGAIIEDLHALLARILWNRPRSKDEGRRVHRFAKERDLGRILSKIEPFQEDPQLLDPHLKTIVPQLVEAYLETLAHVEAAPAGSDLLQLSLAVSTILYTLCKVRGEKIILSFFNNEPKYLESVLSTAERAISREDGTNQSSWQKRYVLLLWLHHLLLTPFHLATVSHSSSSHKVKTASLKIPESIPEVAGRIVSVAMLSLKSSTRESQVAASVLARLSLRPELLGLLPLLSDWATNVLRGASSADPSVLHEYVGTLQFLHRLAASGTTRELRDQMQRLQRTLEFVSSSPLLAYFRSSAVTRKLLIKTQRSLALHALHTDSSAVGDLDPDQVLEEAVQAFLEALGDGDYPVRAASSKALSIVVRKLGTESGGEIIDALLAELNLSDPEAAVSTPFVQADSLKWHGLILTLARLLHQRAVPNAQVPKIIGALTAGINFEQLSTSRSSTGTNVRDAANFGLWALSRRYTTEELTSSSSSIGSSHHGRESTIIRIALELIKSSCTDPVGNIRRGSSAALQELIGRHANIVPDGISVVQIIDYHAVGLRERAMSTVACGVAKLGDMFWEALLDALSGWRGIASSETASRIVAARAIGSLGSQKPQECPDMINRLLLRLDKLTPRDIESWHGLTLALSTLATVNGLPYEHRLETLIKNITSMQKPGMRPELVACAGLDLIKAICDSGDVVKSNVNLKQDNHLRRALESCLRRHEPAVLERIPPTVRSFAEATHRHYEMIDSFVNRLDAERIGAGHLLAVAALCDFGTKKDLNILEKVIAKICSAMSAVTLRALHTIVPQLRIAFIRDVRMRSHESESTTPSIEALPGATLRVAVGLIAQTIESGLNDYTITERGDVGSLVRLEALNVLELLVLPTLLPMSDEVQASLARCVVRLSLEKLDKVRVRALQILMCQAGAQVDVQSVSEPKHFAQALLSVPVEDAWGQEVVRGLCQSAGLGSETVLQAVRLAIADLLQHEQLDTSANLAVILVDCITHDIRNNAANDRVLLPCLETFAYLGDLHLFEKLQFHPDINWTKVLFAVQSAHFKSTIVPKVLICLDVYRSLAGIAVIREKVLAKVKSMLLHPFPKVRSSAAETLLVVTGNKAIKSQDWTLPSGRLKDYVSQIDVLT